MTPGQRNLVAGFVCCLLAVQVGVQVANGAYGWSALLAAVAGLAVLVRISRLPADTLVLGVVVAGYIIGNRGFAQIMLTGPGLPLLPAEAALLLAVGWRTVRCAFERALPIERTALDWAVLAWVLVGTVRVAFDLRAHGLLAIRDYAMCYYALFYFVTRHMVRDNGARAYLLGCCTIALAFLLPVYVLFRLEPEFFLQTLTVWGAPLVYFKGDIAGTMLGVGSVLLFHRAQGSQRRWVWPLAVAMFLFVAAGDNRASLVGTLAAMLLLVAARHWRYAAVQGAAAAVALVAVTMLATLFENAWAERKLHGLADRAASLVDLSGSGTYRSEESYFKGDNNRFRYVWWKNVLAETWATNPAFGAGFGEDLAQGFVREYYPDTAEEFSARSPHNILVTAFGRMGLAGAAIWMGICGTILARVWQALRRSPDPTLWSLWCGAGVILISATFGVVLEGPMGAVPFWVMLGLAGSQETDATAAGSAEKPAPQPEPKPSSEPAPTPIDA